MNDLSGIKALGELLSRQAKLAKRRKQNKLANEAWAKVIEELRQQRLDFEAAHPNHAQEQALRRRIWDRIEWEFEKDYDEQRDGDPYR